MITSCTDDGLAGTGEAGGGEGERGGGRICCLPGHTFMSSQWIMMDDGAFLVDLDFQPGSVLYENYKLIKMNVSSSSLLLFLFSPCRDYHHKSSNVDF